MSLAFPHWFDGTCMSAFEMESHADLFDMAEDEDDYDELCT